MTWLDDALASIASSGEGAVNLAAPQTDRERSLRTLISNAAPDTKSDAAPFSLAGASTDGSDNGIVSWLREKARARGPGMPFDTGKFPVAGDPVASGRPTSNGPGLPPPPNPLGPAGSFPISQPQEKYTDYSMGWPQDSTRPVAKFPDLPPGSPAPPPGMAAQAGIQGLNSPMGGAPGGGAPFSIAGAPPSLAAAQQMTAPPPPSPPMAQQPPVPGLVMPGSAPGIPAVPGQSPTAPVVAQDDGEDAPKAMADDLSSRNRVPSAPQPMLAAPQPEAPAPSIGDRLRQFSPDLIALGAGLSGQGWGGAQELATSRQNLALQAQQGNVTARLLASKGATPQEIAAAVSGGSDVMKALVAQYLGKDKFKVVQTGENDRGRKTFQLMNEQDGSFKEIPGATVQAENASDAAAAAGITGDGFLKTVPNAQDRSLIKQLTQYDLDPGKLSARGGNRERLLALAEQYDPDFKAALYAPRAAALKEFTSGGPNSPASIITNGNTAIQHLGRMSELADKLGGTNKGWILNGAINWANVTLEDMKNNPDLARFKGAQDRFVEEATKFYRGVGGNKADIDRALQVLTAAQSPEARQAAIEEQADLMQSKVNALQDRFKSAVGPSGWKKAMDLAGTEFPIVQQKSLEQLGKIRQRAAGQSIPGAAAPVKPGNYIYRNGALVPE